MLSGKGCPETASWSRRGSAMSFAQLMELARTAMGNHPELVIGGAVALFMLVALGAITRRRRRLNLAALMAAGGQATSTDTDKALNWAPPERSFADRRSSSRREGAPVRVTLSSPTFRNGVNDGFVVDRSTGGLRIAMQSSMAPGSTMQVKAANAPDTVAFVAVIVRSCKKNGDFYELGCEFEKTPPWNVLLLFG